MLSNRMTAKSLELNPARQARKRMLNDRRDCHPAGWVSPPDRPPFPPPPPVAPGRLLACTVPLALPDALCLPSLAAWCSAISACTDCRSVELERPSCHAPVSPSAPYCRKSPPAVCVGFLSWRAPGWVFRRNLIQYRGRYIHICVLTGNTGELQRSISLAIERRWKGAAAKRWAGRCWVPLASHGSTGTKEGGFESFNQSVWAIFRRTSNSAN